MKKQQKLSSNRAITLIALIITIVVMMILVTVTIQAATQTGLFETAGKATKDWKQAQEDESNLKLNIGGKMYDSIEDFQNGIESINEVHDWKKSGDTITCNHCTANYTIGNEVTYTKTGIGNSTISGELSGISQGIEDGYFSEDDFGTNGEQTISKDDETSWIIFGIEDKNRNGTNETLLLTTTMATEDEITLYGAAAYNNVVTADGNQGIIDKVCKDLYGEDARGMTMKDVNNCLGYTPAGAMYDDESGTQTTGNFTTTLSSLTDVWADVQNYNSEYCDSEYYTPKYAEGTSDSSALGNIVLDGYYYYLDYDTGTYLVEDFDEEDTSNTVSEAAKNVVYGSSNEHYYFLASNGVYGTNTTVNFGPARVDCGETYSYGSAFSSEGYSYPMTYAIRPIVTVISETPAKVDTSI